MNWVKTDHVERALRGDVQTLLAQYGKGYQFLTLGLDTSRVVQGSRDLVARFRQGVRP